MRRRRRSRWVLPFLGCATMAALPGLGLEEARKGSWEALLERGID